MIDDIIKKTKAAKKKLEDLDRKRAELEGRRKGLMERLSSEFHLDTVEAAEKMVDTLTDELGDQEKSLRACVSDLDDLMVEMERIDE